MYNTAYNRTIANEVNQINKRYIKHGEKIDNQMKGNGVSGGGVSGGQGQRRYNKNQPDICRHCEGSGMLDKAKEGLSAIYNKGKSVASDIIHLRNPLASRAAPQEGSGLSGGWGISVGFGKRGRPSKAVLAHREEQARLNGGWGISVGFGKKKQQQAQQPTPEQLQGGWGISVGFGKRGRPSKAALAHREEQRQLNGGWGISVGFGKKKQQQQQAQEPTPE